MSPVVGAFVLGAIACFVFTTWARSRWFRQTVGTCCVAGCGRESLSAAFVIEKHGFVIRKAWGLCRWHANDVAMKVHGEGLPCSAPRPS